MLVDGKGEAGMLVDGKGEAGMLVDGDGDSDTAGGALAWPQPPVSRIRVRPATTARIIGARRRRLAL
jgi:hypothetical protein